MKYTGRYSPTEDDYDVMEVTNAKCKKAEKLARKIEAETENEEDRKVVLRNVINTLIEKL